MKDTRNWPPYCLIPIYFQMLQIKKEIIKLPFALNFHWIQSTSSSTHEISAFNFSGLLSFPPKEHNETNVIFIAFMSTFSSFSCCWEPIPISEGKVGETTAKQSEQDHISSINHKALQLRTAKQVDCLPVKSAAILKSASEISKTSVELANFIYIVPLSPNKKACQKFLSLLFLGKEFRLSLALTHLIVVGAFIDGLLAFSIEEAFLLFEEENAMVSNGMRGEAQG